MRRIIQRMCLLLSGIIVLNTVVEPISVSAAIVQEVISEEETILDASVSGNNEISNLTVYPEAEDISSGVVSVSEGDKLEDSVSEGDLFSGDENYNSENAIIEVLETIFVINPFYVDVLDAEDVKAEIQEIIDFRSSISLFSAVPNFGDIVGAQEYLRAQMVERASSVTVQLPRSVWDSNDNIFSTILQGALEYSEDL